MSIVVAIKQDGIIYMGADSQASCGGTRFTLSNPNNYKIWAVQDVAHCLMGSVGLIRANNVLKVADGLIPKSESGEHAVDFRAVIKQIVPRMIEELEKNKVIAKDVLEDTCNMKTDFLLACGDKLYTIDRFGCVIEVDDFCAIGSGSCEAIGSLLSTVKEKDPVERIKTAIKASAAHDIYVDYPIVISNTADTKYQVYYEKDL